MIYVLRLIKTKPTFISHTLKKPKLTFFEHCMRESKYNLLQIIAKDKVKKCT